VEREEPGWGKGPSQKETFAREGTEIAKTFRSTVTHATLRLGGIIQIASSVGTRNPRRTGGDAVVRIPMELQGAAILGSLRRLRRPERQCQSRGRNCLPSIATAVSVAAQAADEIKSENADVTPKMQLSPGAVQSGT